MRRLIAAAALVCLAVPVLASPQDRTTPEKIAALPWVYLKGADGAVRTAREFLNTVLTRAQIEVLPEARVTLMWRRGLGHAKDADRTSLPTTKELLRLGRRLGVDWVVTGRAKWHTRSIWVTLGPKTKSDCTVDILIVDVKRAEVALDARGIRMDSTAKEDALKAAGAIILTPLVTMVSGGPKTPHEQRAVQLAITKALQPWLATRPGIGATERRPIR